MSQLMETGCLPCLPALRGSLVRNLNDPWVGTSRALLAIRSCVTSVLAAHSTTQASAHLHAIEQRFGICPADLIAISPLSEAP